MTSTFSVYEHLNVQEITSMGRHTENADRKLSALSHIALKGDVGMQLIGPLKSVTSNNHDSAPPLTEKPSTFVFPDVLVNLPKRTERSTLELLRLSTVAVLMNTDSEFRNGGKVFPTLNIVESYSYLNIGDYIEKIFETFCFSSTIYYSAVKYMLGYCKVHQLLSLSEAKLLMTACIILAHKIIDDHTHFSFQFAEVLQLSLSELTAMEFKVLSSLDYRVTMSLNEYRFWESAIDEWLDGLQARRLKVKPIPQNVTIGSNARVEGRSLTPRLSPRNPELLVKIRKKVIQKRTEYDRRKIGIRESTEDFIKKMQRQATEAQEKKINEIYLTKINSSKFDPIAAGSSSIRESIWVPPIRNLSLKKIKPEGLSVKSSTLPEPTIDDILTLIPQVTCSNEPQAPISGQPPLSVPLNGAAIPGTMPSFASFTIAQNLSLMTNSDDDDILKIIDNETQDERDRYARSTILQKPYNENMHYAPTFDTHIEKVRDDEIFEIIDVQPSSVRETNLSGHVSKIKFLDNVYVPSVVKMNSANVDRSGSVNDSLTGLPYLNLNDSNMNVLSFHGSGRNTVPIIADPWARHRTAFSLPLGISNPVVQSNIMKDCKPIDIPTPSAVYRNFETDKLSFNANRPIVTNPPPGLHSRRKAQEPSVDLCELFTVAALSLAHNTDIAFESGNRNLPDSTTFTKDDDYRRIFNIVKDLVSRCRFLDSILFTAIKYIRDYVRLVKVEGVSILALIAAAITVSQKVVLDSKFYTNKAISSVSQVPLNKINLMEIDLLHVLDYNIDMTEEDYSIWETDVKSWMRVMMSLTASKPLSMGSAGNGYLDGNDDPLSLIERSIEARRSQQQAGKDQSKRQKEEKIASNGIADMKPSKPDVFVKGGEEKSKEDFDFEIIGVKEVPMSYENKDSSSNLWGSYSWISPQFGFSISPSSTIKTSSSATCYDIGSGRRGVDEYDDLMFTDEWEVLGEKLVEGLDDPQDVGGKMGKNWYEQGETLKKSGIQFTSSPDSFAATPHQRYGESNRQSTLSSKSIVNDGNFELQTKIRKELNCNDKIKKDSAVAAYGQEETRGMLGRLSLGGGTIDSNVRNVKKENMENFDIPSGNEQEVCGPRVPGVKASLDRQAGAVDNSETNLVINGSASPHRVIGFDDEDDYEFVDFCSYKYDYDDIPLYKFGRNKRDKCSPKKKSVRKESKVYGSGDGILIKRTETNCATKVNNRLQRVRSGNLKYLSVY
ncbi:hypothetical protein HK098_008014 [Nowakowskiella sp. JEL0407]|nr:hypothetical protein HK098_008014 [Nowakowskiella sp. JEL0407]